jgi:sodium/bile acid cotransporter 7
MKRHFIRRWFLLALMVVIVGGFFAPRQLAPLVDLIWREAIVFGVLFLMAFSLDAHTMWRAMRRPGAAALATAINFGLLPLVAWGFSLAMFKAGWLGQDLAIGLLIVGATPSTLASAAVWTRRAGGNDAVALLVTMITNLICFVVTPLWLLWSTGKHAPLDLSEMIGRLAVLVVLPMALAQVLRAVRPLGRWATAQRIPLGVIAQCGVLTMILIGSVNCGNKLLAGGGSVVGVGQWLAMLAAVAAIHLITLYAGHVLGRAASLPREERIAVGFSGSQKTLMIGLEVALTYFADLPLAMLPMVAYHVTQLILDTAVADRLRRGRPDS